MPQDPRVQIAKGVAGSGTPSYWYKDVVIYQTHVRAFFDSDNDGVGDFRGLTEKLDYIVDLGVTALWLLPFFPSPLRDDGYDITDYTNVNPAYGTLDDFRDFVEAAHARGIRVLIESVINHTSDQHPWFQRARRAPAGSQERDFYVWSDTGSEYEEARVIFIDSEISNWTWDPVAGAFFWHRFYSHQPDLNYDNPLVVREIKNVLKFWLDVGVDGFRLDAVPYLIEREGTSSENLPETHDVLATIRQEIERYNPECVLLAEANQPAIETMSYFGAGNECHMALHFPLMPRLFMGLAQESREPVADILGRTTEMAECCQWALFLRNHDELTLEMVTEEERSYLWKIYAAHRRMRINLGIRRRLSPLLNHDRRRIELMNSLLFSLPGTPVIYYGDEIGMGDNPFLGDRDAVRTPMQWSSDRNGGFSRADHVALYLPPIVDPRTGYRTVNVESQRHLRSSLFNWMRWMIRVRNAHRSFSRGRIELLQPNNRKILAYLRIYGEEIILCVASFSETPQAAEFSLAEWAGRVPVDLFGAARFPAVTGAPYTVTLTGHGFFWLKLLTPAEADARQAVPLEAMDRPHLPEPDRPAPGRPRG